MARLNCGFAHQSRIIKDIHARCERLHTASNKILHRYNDPKSTLCQSVLVEKVRNSLELTENVLRSSLSNLSNQCNELRLLFLVSGFKQESDYYLLLRNYCASALLQCNLQSYQSYPPSKHLIEELNSLRFSFDFGEARESTIKMGSSTRPASAPGNICKRPQSAYKKSSNLEESNELFQHLIDDSNALANGMLVNKVENRNDFEYDKQWCESNTEDEEVPRSSNHKTVQINETINSNIYDDDGFIAEDRTESPDILSTLENKDMKRINSAPSIRNSSNVDDDRAQAVLQNDTSLNKLTTNASHYSLEFNKKRPLSAKQKDDLVLQSWPNFIYDTEVAAGRETQWHVLPCPHCLKLFKGISKI